MEAEIAGGLGNTYRDLGRIDDALKYLKRSVMLAKRDARERTLVVAYLDLARAYLYKRAYDDAEEALANAHRVAATLSRGMISIDTSHSQMVNCLLQLTRLLHTSETDVLVTPPEEWTRLARSLRAYVGKHSPVWWRLLDIFDRPEHMVGRYLKRVYELSANSSDRPAHATAGFLYGLYVEKVNKDQPGATRLFKKASEALETTRGNIVQLGYRRSYIGRNVEIYDRLVSSYVQTGDLEQAFDTAERSRARGLFELLQTGPLSASAPLNYEFASWDSAQIKSSLDRTLLRSHLASIVARTPSVSMGEVCRSLAPEECLLQFHMLAEETYIFALGSSGIMGVFRARYGHRMLDDLLEEKQWWKRIDELEKVDSNSQISLMPDQLMSVRRDYMSIRLGL